MLTTYKQELYPKRGLESVFLRTIYGDTRGKLSVVLPSKVQHRLLKFMGPFMPQTLSAGGTFGHKDSISLILKQYIWVFSPWDTQALFHVLISSWL